MRISTSGALCGLVCSTTPLVAARRYSVRSPGKFAASRENFTLSETERGEQLQQLADNKIRLIQEQDELEQKQLELFGIRLPQDQMKREIEQASSYWLSPTSIRRLITIYLQRNCAAEIRNSFLAINRLKRYVYPKKPETTCCKISGRFHVRTRPFIASGKTGSRGGTLIFLLHSIPSALRNIPKPSS